MRPRAFRIWWVFEDGPPFAHTVALAAIRSRLLHVARCDDLTFVAYEQVAIHSSRSVPDGPSAYESGSVGLPVTVEHSPVADDLFPGWLIVSASS